MAAAVDYIKNLLGIEKNEQQFSRLRTKSGVLQQIYELEQVQAIVEAVRSTIEKGYRWVPLFFTAVGFCVMYVIIFMCVGVCLCAGGLFHGSVLAAVVLTLAGVVQALKPGPIQLWLLAGLALGIFPATWSGDAVVKWYMYSGADIAGGTNSETYLNASHIIPDYLDYDVWHTLNAIVLEEFIGQVHVDLPRADEYGISEAGKEESGTFCVMPIVYDGWTQARPVPLWLVCENDYQGHVDCVAARDGNYSKADYYGYRILEECFSQMREYQDRNLRRNPDPVDRYVTVFWEYDFANYEPKAEFAVSAITDSKRQWNLASPLETKAVRFKGGEMCCDDQMASVQGNAATISFAFLIPLPLLLFRTIWVMLRKQKMIRYIMTREDIQKMTAAKAE